MALEGKRKGNMWRVRPLPKDISNKVFKASPSTPDMIKKKDTFAPILEAPLDVSNSKIKASRAQVELLQARLGHPGKQQEAGLRKILKDLPNHSFCPFFCNSCTQGKMIRNPSREKMRSVSAPLGRVHMDLWGPISHHSKQGNRYILSITDQYTGMIWMYFLTNKSQAKGKVREWIDTVESQRRRWGSSEKVKAIRFDRGREFLNTEFMKWCDGGDFAIEPTVGYHPEGDGFLERSMRTIMEKANTIRFGMKMELEFWQLAA